MMMSLLASSLNSQAHSGDFVLHFSDPSLPSIALLAHTLCSALSIPDSEEAYKSIQYFLSSQPPNSYIKFHASYETDKKSFFHQFSRGGFVGFVPVPWRACLAFGDVELLHNQYTLLPLSSLQDHFKLPRLFEPSSPPSSPPVFSQPISLVCVPTA